MTWIRSIGSWTARVPARVAWWAGEAARGLWPWVRGIGVSLMAFVGALVLVTWTATGTGRRSWIPVALGALVVAGLGLSDLMRRRRRQDGASTWPARTAFALLVLGVGVLLVAVRATPLSYFLGVALGVTACSWLVSEVRAIPTGVRPRVATGLLVGAVALLALAAAPPVGRAIWVLVAVGLVLAEIGTEVISAHVSTAPRDPGRWHVRAVGIGLALLAGCAIGLAVWPGNMEPAHLGLLLAGLAVVVAMAAADSDGLVLVVVIAVALLWASAPREADMRERLVPVEGERYFLVLGDSYISGEGAVTYLRGTNTTAEDAPGSDQTNECRRAPTAWPVGLAASRSVGVPGRLLFHACSGAVTENIDTEPRLARGDQQGPAELALFERDRERLGDPEFVVIGIGGNDAGFSRIGETCVGPGSCARIAQQFVDDGAPGPTPETPGVPDGPEDLASIGDDLDEAFGNVRDSVGPDIPVVAVPYPIPLTETGRCDDLLLDRAERLFLVHFVTRLNDIVEAEATRNGVLYMDTMEGALRDHGTRLCDGSGSSGLNFLAFNPKAGDQREALRPTNWTHNSFHPNADGHEAMRIAAVEWFAQNSPLAVPAASEAVADRSISLDEIYGDANPPKQCNPDPDAGCRLAGGRWARTQAGHAYRVGFAPIALAAAAIWLLLAPARRWISDRDLSILEVVRIVRDRPRQPPIPPP